MMRLDIKFRVDSSTNTLTVDHPTIGAPTAVTLTSGVYDSLALLCAEIEARLIATIDPDLECTEDDGLVTIEDTNPIGPFSITWDHPTLRNFLGWSGNVTGASAYTAPAVSAGTFVGSLPWFSDQPLGWEWHLKRFTDPRGTHGGSTKLGSVSVWEVDALALWDDVPGFRSVLSYLLRGLPARWWRDTSVSTAWSTSNWWGRLDVAAHPDWRSYGDQWKRPDLTALLTVPLRLVEG